MRACLHGGMVLCISWLAVSVLPPAGVMPSSSRGPASWVLEARSALRFWHTSAKGRGVAVQA